MIASTPRQTFTYKVVILPFRKDIRCPFVLIKWRTEINHVPGAARTSLSNDFTSFSDSCSHLEHMGFDWPKDIQTRSYSIGYKETHARKIYEMERLSAYMFERFIEWNA